MLFENDFYGDKTLRWFIGRAVNNRDPAMQGRIQIQIDGIHSPSQADIVPDQLPWAITMNPTTEGGTSGIGRFTRIQPGALVYGIFLDGITSQVPMIMGVLNQYENPTPSQPGLEEVGHNGTVVSSETLAAITSGAVNTNTGGQTTSSATSAPSASSSNNASLNAKRWACMNFFVKDNGLSLNQAAGIVGNLQQESSLDSAIVNSIGASGLAQWLGSRKQQLFNFASLKGKAWQDFDLQLEFIMHELRGVPLPNSSADRDGASKERSAYGHLLNTTKFLGGNDNLSSTYIFCVKYERPGRHERVISTRERYAQAAYDVYTSSAAVS
jgi:hypothetical protein